MNTAQSVRLLKEQHPERYCSDPRCLWMVRSRTGDVTPCRKHPEREGEILARGLALDNLSLVRQHAPELATGLDAVVNAVRVRSYRTGLAALDLVSAYFSNQERPFTDDESIASRHLKAAREQIARLSGGSK